MDLSTNRFARILLRSALIVLAFTTVACGGNGGGAESGASEQDSGRRPGNGRPGTGDDDDATGDATGDDESPADGSGNGEGSGEDAGAIDDAIGGRDAAAPADAGSTDSGISPPDVSSDAVVDGPGEWEIDGGSPADPVLCPESSIVPPLCVASVDEDAAGLCDGFDNDCDGVVDENCRCKLGDVIPCFAGPPGRVETGACASGTQRCITGSDGDFEWSACLGGISPSAETCDGLDNDCNGCTDELAVCDGGAVSCPGPGDPRTPDATPFTDYPLRGTDFYAGVALDWSWTIQGGPCDGIVAGRRSFDLAGANSANATFTPRLSGSYTVTLRVQTPDGFFECTWIIHVVGPGVRIEMCYPESETQDLDLLIMRTTTPGSWYPTRNAFNPNTDACSWYNCEANIRGGIGTRRADWGYPNTPLANCEGGPQGAQWRSLGSCSNPRLDIDNNLSEGIGLPENINIDNPNMGDAFRIMVHNFTGQTARPVVNIYCGGRLKATFGAAPDEISGYAASRSPIGAMWRVADVVAFVDEAGVTVDCEVTALHPPGAAAGYDITIEDARF
jgi:hypothetical protein